MHVHSHDPDGTSPLGFTGERVIPGQPEWAWCFQAHKFGYDDLAARITPGARITPAARITPGPRICDIGCGEGYGAASLATAGARVVASDYSFEAVAHARATYGTGVAWLVCDAQRLPFAPGVFDVVCSLQVIEHFRDTDAHLSGVARALAPGGWHYVATPNIDEMSAEEKDNEYHLRDFTAPELRQVLEQHFEQVELLGMFYVESSPRVRSMRGAEAAGEAGVAKIARVEHWIRRLPGPLRVRARDFLRGMTGAPSRTVEEARNAIVAEDFEARAPAEESFCLIGIARGPKQ